jgi:glucose-1-phosphate thymidylyltransferase
MRYPKELLPIVYEPASGTSGGVRARAVAEYALDAIRATGADGVLIIVAPWKLDVLTYFGDGRSFGIDLGYLFQEEARGLPHALDLAYPWVAQDHVVFAMPDTIVAPSDALALLRESYTRADADLALAVFPTDEAHRMGPVVMDGERVVRVYDKPELPPVMNTWGAAVWGPAFSRLLHDSLYGRSDDTAEPALGDYFDLAVRSGLNVVARHFPLGSYEDAGTNIGILRCLGTDQDAKSYAMDSPRSVRPT